MSSPSIHQSVFVKPEHEVRAFVRWRLHCASLPYAEVHLNVGDFGVCFFVDQAQAPEFTDALGRLRTELRTPVDCED